LVDADQSGMPGFGVPDVIEDISSETDLQDLMQNTTLLNSLFDKKEAKKNRDVPDAQLFKIEIAPLGKHIDEWQKSPDSIGWIVPFKYAAVPLGDNYNIRIYFKKPKIDPENPEAAHSQLEYLQIEYIEKEFTKAGNQYEPSAGKVVEYFHPRKDFTGLVKARVDYEDSTKKITFEFPDGTIIDGVVTQGKNKFIEDTPYAKSYNEGSSASGAKRWWIESSNGDGNYDKRKSVGQPKEITGEYYGDAMDDARAQYGASHPSDDTSDNRKVKDQTFYIDDEACKASAGTGHDLKMNCKVKPLPPKP